MGEVIKTRVHIEGHAYDGEAQLETHEIRFRGERRLVMPLASLTSVRAEDGALVVMHEGERVVLDLGVRAEKWAHRILHPKSVLEKLGVKKGRRARVVQFDDPAFVRDLETAGVDVCHEDEPGTGFDLIFVGIDSQRQIERFRPLVPDLARDGSLWILRPKGSSAITEAAIRAAARGAGLVDVKVVSFSEQTTADKFVIPRARRASRRTGAER